jgi:hypothetical protein
LIFANLGFALFLPNFVSFAFCLSKEGSFPTAKTPGQRLSLRLQCARRAAARTQLMRAFMNKKMFIVIGLITPTMVGGQPVKVNGTITYQFSPE